MNPVLDQFGLVKDNEYLVVFLPPVNRALVFRVVGRSNAGREIFNYGALPISAGASLATFEGGSTSVPADGVLPGRSYTPTGITFPLTGAYDSSDMWYVPEDYRDRLFHVIQYITPAFLRIEVQIPINVSQGRFQRDKVYTGIDKDFGFSRGRLEAIHIPKVHYGYRYGNDTNIPVYVFVKFIYAEYIVETPKSPELIFNILLKRVPAYWYTMPIATLEPTVRSALQDAYGYEGFPIYTEADRGKALKEYEDILKRVRI